VGKPNEREREREREILLFSFKKVHINSKLTISSQEKYLTAPNMSPTKLYPKIRAQIHTTVRPPQKQCLENRANRMLYGLHSMAQQQQENPPKQPRFLCQVPQKLHPLSLYVMYGSVQYSPTAANENSTHTENCPWDLCPFVPTLSWEMYPPSCSLSSLKLSRKISLNLLLLLSCTLPNAFFYNLKMTFSLQSVFSPSPTLNPKDKI
jgi:hypothetical protein